MNTQTNTWFYDELSSLFDKKETEDQIRIKKMQRSVDAKFGAGEPSFVFSKTSPLFGDVVEIPFSCPSHYRPYAELDLDNFAGAMQFRRNFKRTHPFLIGPATLESLLDKPVDNYDYITTGKLPFNPLFFEFTENVSATIPRIKRSNVTLQGVYLCASSKKEGLEYVFTSFWKDVDGEILGIDLFMDDPRATHFRGLVTHLSRSNFDLDKPGIDRNRYQFVIDANNKIHISRTAKKEAALALAIHQNTGQLVDLNNLFDESLPLDSISANVFSMIPSLSINIINYINAHNVTIATRSRNLLEPLTLSTIDKKPYSIIQVKEETYDEPLTQHQGHILTYQLAIKGHNRRLRDEAGNIRKISWIAPYIKGPEGTPYYDTRHEVTAKKIIAERQLFANL